MATYFVSDLHLSRLRPAAAAVFQAFLSGRPGRGDSLYILGDLFDYWAGDDDVEDAFNREIVAGLARCGERGVHTFFLRGNRDFLAGEGLARAARLELLPEHALVQVCGRRTLLTHGDELCTEDLAYQAFRRRVRDPDWMRAFLARPLAQRRAEIESLRSQSEAHKRGKSALMMDVSLAAVVEVLRRYGLPRLIHGHTHRQGRHEMLVDGAACERWVLPDWYSGGEVLVGDDGGLRWERLPWSG
ncbi:MAG: UDP-2,3-diacylglucosamine diphosphatase [Burkholderiales bacterium]|nr:UDP-2,3-diacylglucosamine diphosphatase [Burkholderiales bacterium]